MRTYVTLGDASHAISWWHLEFRVSQHDGCFDKHTVRRLCHQFMDSLMFKLIKCLTPATITAGVQLVRLKRGEAATLRELSGRTQAGVPVTPSRSTRAGQPQARLIGGLFPSRDKLIELMKRSTAGREAVNRSERQVAAPLVVSALASAQAEIVYDQTIKIIRDRQKVPTEVERSTIGCEAANHSEHQLTAPLTVSALPSAHSQLLYDQTREIIQARQEKQTEVNHAKQQATIPLPIYELPSA
jgi:hypothetical protein